MTDIDKLGVDEALGAHSLDDIAAAGVRPRDYLGGQAHAHGDGHLNPPTLRRMSDVAAEAVRWLWPPYLPLGKLTLLEGDPGVGKSWLTLAISTAVSLGQGPPGMTLDAPGRVLLLTAEDGLGDTVRPRLDALGADVNNIIVLDGQIALAELDLYASRVQPTLIVVDPLSAFLGADVDMFRANETRPVLAMAASLAERLGCAVLIVRHITKGAAGRAIYRGQGTIDFTAAARSVLLAGCDPEEPRKCAFVHIKSNLAAKGEPIGYRLEEGRFSWAGVSDLTASRILGGAEDSEAPSKLDEAIDFLQQSLGLGGQPAEKVKDDAKALGITDRTLRRAREALDVRANAIHRQEGKGVERWEWALPPAEYLDDQSPYAGNGHLNGNGHHLESLADIDRTYMKQEAFS
jgi:AAA domain